MALLVPFAAEGGFVQEHYIHPFLSRPQKVPSGKVQPEHLVFSCQKWPLARHPTAEPDRAKALSDGSKGYLQAKFLLYLLSCNKRVTTGCGHNQPVLFLSGLSWAPISSRVSNPCLFVKGPNDARNAPK